MNQLPYVVSVPVGDSAAHEMLVVPLSEELSTRWVTAEGPRVLVVFMVLNGRASGVRPSITLATGERVRGAWISERLEGDPRMSGLSPAIESDSIARALSREFARRARDSGP